MNLKKIFAAVSGVILAAQTLLPASVLGATTYGDELQSAYDYAYSEGITTQYPVDNANMFGAITRAEMAKMLGQWAINTLGMAPDTSKDCAFSDVASVNEELQGWITKSCQLGLMGQGITAFAPYNTITRAEFGTALSRALRGDTNEGGTPYYAAHLQALKNAGIMTQIEPDMKEIRGYVMIMLQRTSEGIDDGTIEAGTSQCDDPIIQLACIMETDACPAACRDREESPDTTVKAGDLDVSVADYSSTVKSAPANGTVIFNSLKLKASEAITLNGITVKMAGLTSRSNVEKVRFERDGVALTNKSRPTTEGTANLNFKGGFVIKSNENIDLVVTLTGTAGGEVSFEISKVDSSAEKLSLGDVLSTTYRTTNYKVAEVNFNADTNGTTASYKVGSQEDYTIGKISLQNDGSNKEDREVAVKSITLQNTQRVDLSPMFKTIKVLRDGTDVAKNVTFDGRNVTISLNDTLAAGKRGVYTLVGILGTVEEVPSVINLQLKSSDDIVAYETNSNFRVGYSGSTTNASLGTYTFNGGKVTFTNDSTFPKTVEAGSGARDVVLASGMLNVSEPIELPVLNISGNCNNVIRTIALEIAGTRYSADIAADGSASREEGIVISRNSTIKLLANLENAPTSTSCSLAPSTISSALFGIAGNGTGTYVNTDSDLPASDVAGRINIASLSVKTPSFSLTNSSSAKPRFIINESSTNTMFEGNVTSSKVDVVVDRVELTLIPTLITGPTTYNVDFDLVIDGSTVDSKTVAIDSAYTGSTIDFNTNFTANSTAKTVKVVASSAFGYVGSLSFDLQMFGTDSNNNNNTNTSKVASVVAQVVANATATPSNSSSVSKAVIDGNSIEVASWTTEVKYGTINLTGVTVAGLTMPTTGVKLEFNGGSYDADATSTANSIVFKGLNETLPEGKHTFKVTANIDTATSTGGQTGNINSATIFYDNTSSLGNLTLNYIRLKAFPKIAKTSDTEITITNVSEETIHVPFSGLTFTGSGNKALAGQDGAGFVKDIPAGGTAIITVTPDKDASMQLKSITYTVDNDEPGATVPVRTYTLNSLYTNIADRGLLVIRG